MRKGQFRLHQHMHQLLTLAVIRGHFPAQGQEWRAMRGQNKKPIKGPKKALY